MNGYAVEWAPTAEDQLADLWLVAPDQSAVTTATHEVERRLRAAPLAVGESRRSSVSRFVVFPPLAVWFEVIADDRRVIVTAVSRAG
jgi:hypothetical protein